MTAYLKGKHRKSITTDMPPEIYPGYIPFRDTPKRNNPMDVQEFRGLELAAKANIEWTGTYWLVPSSSRKGSYRVDARCTECTCDDFELTCQPCKHLCGATRSRTDQAQPARSGGPRAGC